VWGIGPVVLFVGISLIAVAGAGSAVAYRYDRATVSTHILPGVTIDGIDVGNMTRRQAMEAVSSEIDRTLSRSITVRAGGHTWTRTLGQLGLSADVRTPVDAAFAVSTSYSWVSRVFHRLTHRPIARSFEVRFSFVGRPVKDIVAEASKVVAQPGRDASIGLDPNDPEGPVVFVHSQTGRALRSYVGERLLRKMVLDHRHGTVHLPSMAVDPKVTDDSIGKTIVVNRTTNTLTLFDGFDVEKRYGVATAMNGFLTPPGEWTIWQKVENPTWYNPCLGQPDCWAANEPPTIPPGPDNPLGTRALYLDAPGIRIHGTPSDSSIGTWASHGCIRMHIPESEELYPLVPVGTKVLIIGAPPWGDVVPDQPAGT
jgi:lipoprotein-anchoring transpeptidase ErfK/SrfK